MGIKIQYEKKNASFGTLKISKSLQNFPFYSSTFPLLLEEQSNGKKSPKTML